MRREWNGGWKLIPIVEAENKIEVSARNGLEER